MENRVVFSSAEVREAARALAASAMALAASMGADLSCLPAGGLPDGGLPAGGSEGGSPEGGSGPLEGGDPLRDLADASLDGLSGLARVEAQTAALKVLVTGEYLDTTKALAAPELPSSAQEMAEIAEVAGVLGVSERSAGAFLGECVALTSRLPLTLAALGAGTLSWQHARVMVDETANLDAAGAAALEAHFLDPSAPDPARGCPAGELVPGRFRAKARTWRERHHPVSIETRHRKCAADRRVEFVPDSDGMAWFNTYLPAETAAGIWNRTTAQARALQGPAEPRTLTQLRSDIAATLLLNGSDSGDVGADVPVPRAQVLVTVPVMSLLGVTEEPAMLDGYGPIPPSMARRLVADGADSFHRVLVDPRDGAPLEIGRTSYRVTKALRQWLRLRDAKCSFRGCNNASLDNDADHLLAWADGGTTGISNLGQPCRKHHRLKHTTAWTPAGATKESPPGWTSPTGRHYPSEHQDWEPPHWPDSNLLTDANPDPGRDPDVDLLRDPFADWFQFTEGREPEPETDPEDPGWDPDSELPTDPFPDWCQFTAA
ncbi:endonuclease [Arthrobacter sp. EPSL27]|nr:HNH endonuclease signature motif containing protein [Arthrobacter sp. EPSL27]KUM37823.1 endonuclease [Arthrobacter sp. EPSL27]